MQLSNELLWIITIVVNFSLLMLMYRFMGKTGLIVWVAVASLIANIQVIKLVELFGFDATLGNIVYGTSFLATDILSENYSKSAAKKSIWIGFAAIIVMLVIMKLATLFIPAEGDFASESLNTIFGIMPRIVIASLLAYIIAQHHDVWAYQFWKNKFPDTKYIFIRNNASTMVSQLIDTSIFTLVAFLGVFPGKTLVQIIATTYILKWLVALLDTGCVYLAAKWHKNGKIREF